MKNIAELTVKINVEFDGLYAELQDVKRQLVASERRAVHWKAIAESRLRMNTAAPDAFSVAEVYRWFDVPPSLLDDGK